MRGFPPDATSRARVRERRHGVSDHYVSTNHAAREVLAMFARLGVLLMVALFFGLTAQYLVGMSPH